jgi:amino acid transporter
MPYTEDELAVFEAGRHLGNEQRFDTSPSKRQRLGQFSVVCLILNRTIGSGIFVTPAKVLAGTGSVGGSLLFWAAGAIISICGLFVWLECSMSMPQRHVKGHNEPRGVPRSGGEKNYLEFMFPGKQFRVTSIYGIMFIVLGNLSGNAIAFGIYILEAANRYDPTKSTDGSTPEPNHPAVIGLAIASLTVAILLHICSRRGGILVNNCFAVIKVLILLVLICIGLAKAGGAFSSTSIPDPHNFKTSTAFSTKRHDVASYSDSLLYIIYTYSGFEQPFYVLSEVKKPRKIFPTWTLTAMAIAASLFLMINVAYLFAIQKMDIINNPNIDMATVFFRGVFGDESSAQRAMAALIAFSIFGNIVVMTFTAARVKQEIAKEGILPFSLTFATSHTTPFAWLTRHFTPPSSSTSPLERLEQTPMAALALHWCSSVFLILVTIPAKPTTAYNILVSLYSYTIIVLVGAWVSFGLLLTKLRTEKFHWKTRRRYRPLISPVHALVYFGTCAFVLVCAFVPPGTGSPYAYKEAGIKWYIVPIIGLSSPLWGLLWYYAFLGYQKWSGWDLQVDRRAFWMRDPDHMEEYVQRAEVVSHFWTPRAGREGRMAGFADGHGEGEGDTSDDSGVLFPDQGRDDHEMGRGGNLNQPSYVGGLVGRRGNVHTTEEENENLNASANANSGPIRQEIGGDSVYEMPDYAR